MGLSTTHLIIFLVIIIVIFGTKKLRNIGSDLGGAVKGFKDGMKDGSDKAAEAVTPAAAPVQQVAGATGVALFIALMTAQSATLTAGGAIPVDALTGGIRLAFLVGAVISLLPILCAFFVRKPAPQPGMENMGGH